MFRTFRILGHLISNPVAKIVKFVGKTSREEILIYIDEMLAKNEAHDSDRYKLSKSPIAKSGYTFGRCQHDLGHRSDARNFIRSCLERANVVTEQIDIIIKKLADYTLKLSRTELETVNTALSLQENIEAINQFDKAHMGAAIDHVAAIIDKELKSETGDKVAQIIVRDLRAFLQLIDYHNQFYLSADGPLVKFLNGESVDRSDIKESLVATLNTKKLNIHLLDEIRRFINEYTKYGINHRDDCIRRQKAIDGLDYQRLSLSRSSDGNSHPMHTGRVSNTTPRRVPTPSPPGQPTQPAQPSNPTTTPTSPSHPRSKSKHESIKPLLPPPKPVRPTQPIPSVPTTPPPQTKPAAPSTPKSPQPVKPTKPTKPQKLPWKPLPPLIPNKPPIIGLFSSSEDSDLAKEETVESGNKKTKLVSKL